MSKHCLAAFGCKRPSPQKIIQGEDIKHNPEMGETAIQPVPAQTADLSISGLLFMSSPCTWPLTILCLFWNIREYFNSLRREWNNWIWFIGIEIWNPFKAYRGHQESESQHVRIPQAKKGKRSGIKQEQQSNKCMPPSRICSLKELHRSLQVSWVSFYDTNQDTNIKSASL